MGLPLKEPDLIDAVSRLTGARCRSLQRLETGFSSSTTYTAALDGGALVVVKINDDARVLVRTEHNLDVLTQLGVPVPRLLGYDDGLPGHRGAILVMERLAGDDLGVVIETLTRQQLRRLAAEIVEIQRRVATLPANTGCGYVGIGETATRSWSDVVRRPSPVLPADPLPDDSSHLMPMLQSALTAADPYFERVRPTAFLDDATTKNVMVRDGRLVGIVDLDVICYGDPLFQIGLTGASVAANTVGGAPRVYVDEQIRLTELSDEQRGIVALYEAVFLVHFLVAENPHTTGAWRTRAITAAEQRLRPAARSWVGFQWPAKSEVTDHRESPRSGTRHDSP